MTGIGRAAGVMLAIVTVGCLTLLGIVFAEPIVDLMFFGKGFDDPLPAGAGYGFEDKRELTVFLSRIILAHVSPTLTP